MQRTARLRKKPRTSYAAYAANTARYFGYARSAGLARKSWSSLAARLQDLDIIRLEAGIERREPAQWDELRVWDPGDG